jgi:hypothetical protein
MMWIPTKIYESLPVLYVTVGALLLLGALYIGVDHELMPGYMAVGASCMIGGIFVTYIRHKARSKAESNPTRSDQAAT